MKKTMSILLCAVAFLIAFGASACSNTGGKTPNSEPETSSADIADNSDMNVFAFKKAGTKGDEITVTMSVGGEKVKVSGFKIVLTFDEDIQVKSVEKKFKFSALTFNDDTDGRLVLLWAVTQSVNAESEVCDITFSVNSAENTAISGSLAKNGISYFNAKTNDFEEVKGRVVSFDLSNI